MKKLISNESKRVWEITIELSYTMDDENRAMNKAKLIEKILNKKNYINNVSFTEHRINVEVYGVTEAFYLMNNLENLMNRKDGGQITNVELKINNY